jgi:hypothetical protein
MRGKVLHFDFDDSVCVRRARISFSDRSLHSASDGDIDAICWLLDQIIPKSVVERGSSWRVGVKSLPTSTLGHIKIQPNNKNIF